MADAIAALYEKHLPNYARGRLVDLGCGPVPLFATYRDYVSETICVDWASATEKRDHLDYEWDLSKTLPFADSEFDTVILSDVLEHIPTPETLWSEMRRILRPDGIAFVNTPFFYWVHSEPHDYYRYTSFALTRFAEQSGFNVLLLEAIGGSPEIFADLFAKHVVLLPLIGGAAAIAVQAVSRYMANTKFGKTLSQKSAVKFPFGYFMIAQKA